MLAAAAFLLDAGGMAVKVESAGLAHAPHIWRGFARRGDTLAAYDAMVTLVGGSKGAYSCGMHNFGLADAGTEEVPTEEVPELLTAFNQWNLLARPALESGSVFARSLSEPAVALRHEGFGYDEDSILNNPHGKWSLQPTDQVVDPAKPDTEDGPLFLLMDHTSEPHRRATAQAQSTLWRLAEFGSNPTSWGQALVKFCIEHDDDRAHMWAVLESMEDEAVVASLFEVPPEFPNHTPGNPVTVPFDAVEDWAIRRHGSVIGGFTLQLQAQSVSEEHRRWQQLYTGNLAFLPTDELMAPTPGPIEAPVPQQSDNVPWWRRLMPW
jgi:uncharacterized protein YegJ (DUF2314 family)